MRGDLVLAEDLADLGMVRVKASGLLEVPHSRPELPRLDVHVAAQEMRHVAVRLDLQQVVGVLPRRMLVAAQGRNLCAYAADVRRLRCDRERARDRALRCVEVVAARLDQRLVREERRQVRSDLQRSIDRLACLDDPPSLDPGDREGVEQHDVVGIEGETSLRGLGCLVPALEIQQRLGADLPVVRILERVLADVPESVERPLRALHLDVVPRQLEPLVRRVAHPAHASASSLRSTRAPAEPHQRRPSISALLDCFAMELRDLPSVDELARGSTDALAVEAARSVLARAREEIGAGADPGDLAARLEAELSSLRTPRLRRVINAAGVMLALAALAEGREVLVSRGELLEIGDGFRIPDVLARSGALLREVGTTNRTRAADYERAIGPETGLLLRVHQSNFRVVGFTEQPAVEELAAVARAHGLPLVDDLGSGALEPSNSLLLGDEPTARASLAAGADLVCFSGD